MKTAVGLTLFCVAVFIACWWPVGPRETSPVAEFGPTPAAPALSTPVATSVLTSPSVAEPERHAVDVPAQEPSVTDGAPRSSEGAVVTSGPVAETLSFQRVRIVTLEAQVAKLQRELDECRFGPDSILGTAHALPEWSTLDRTQQAVVTAFLERFPVRLGTGEAWLIATHKSPTGDTTAEIISLLGRSRVLAAMDPEARQRFGDEDPDEFREYFGGLLPR